MLRAGVKKPALGGLFDDVLSDALFVFWDSYIYCRAAARS